MDSVVPPWTNSNGVTSLPNNLLLRIFSLAVSTDGTRTAVRISHVSSRFRTIALAGRRLWTSIDSNAPRDALKAFIERSGEEIDLHITIHVNSRSYNLTTFMDICGRTVPRWKSLAVMEGNGIEENGRLADTVLKTLDNEYDMQLLRLHGLHILHFRRWCADPAEEGDGGVGKLRWRPRWKSPSLRALRSDSYVPTPSPAFSSLSSFSSTIFLLQNAYRAQVQDVFSFLSSTPSIVQLELNIHPVSDDYDDLDLGQLNGPHITFFKLRVTDFDVGEENNDFMAAFMNALHLPRLEHFSLSLGVNIAHLMAKGGDANGTDLLSELASALLPDPTISTHLKTLTIELYPDTLPYEEEEVDPEDMPALLYILPLDRIPTVSCLALTALSPLGIRFTLGERLPKPGPAPSSLRELELRECRTMNNEELQEMIDSLIDVGAWQNLERIKMERCDALAFDGFECYRRR